MSGGTLTGWDLDMSLQLQVLNAPLLFNLTGGAMEVELLEGGAMRGVIAGVVPIDEIIEQTDLPEINISELVADLVTAAADVDLGDDGTCDGLSITFEFEATHVWLPEE